jgi:general secretion pathway protein K
MTRTSAPRAGGAAVVGALLVCALAAALATSLLGRIDDWIGQVASSRDRAQALELARGGIDYARVILADDLLKTKVDTVDEDWARVLPPIGVDGAELSGRIEDQQGRWNLNNLLKDGTVDREALAVHRRLLAALGIPAELADTLADWLDADDTLRPGGAESAYYLSLQPAYPAANRAMEHPSNLLRVKGYDAAMVRRLAPFVTVLPGRQPVNVNTAPAEVLHALFADLSLADARQLVAARQTAHFRDTDDFRARLPDRDAAPAAEVSVSSQFFLARANVQVGGARVALSSLLARDGAKRPTVLWQSQQ